MAFDTNIECFFFFDWQSLSWFTFTHVLDVYRLASTFFSLCVVTCFIWSIFLMNYWEKLFEIEKNYSLASVYIVNTYFAQIIQLAIFEWCENFKFFERHLIKINYHAFEPVIHILSNCLNCIYYHNLSNKSVTSLASPPEKQKFPYKFNYISFRCCHHHHYWVNLLCFYVNWHQYLGQNKDAHTHTQTIIYNPNNEHDTNCFLFSFVFSGECTDVNNSLSTSTLCVSSLYPGWKRKCRILIFPIHSLARQLGMKGEKNTEKLSWRKREKNLIKKIFFLIFRLKTLKKYIYFLRGANVSLELN